MANKFRKRKKYEFWVLAMIVSHFHCFLLSGFALVSHVVLCSVAKIVGE